ncbi:hypothetical protein [Rugamonas sp.]|nr:hypothetical protein [Rugamonas sp.]
MNTSHYQAIAALDLEPIKVKLMHRESGKAGRWSGPTRSSLNIAAS